MSLSNPFRRRRILKSAVASAVASIIAGGLGFFVAVELYTPRGGTPQQVIAYGVTTGLNTSAVTFWILILLALLIEGTRVIGFERLVGGRRGMIAAGISLALSVAIGWFCWARFTSGSAPYHPENNLAESLFLGGMFFVLLLPLTYTLLLSTHPAVREETEL
jgi:hypothetical protein